MWDSPAHTACWTIYKCATLECMFCYTGKKFKCKGVRLIFLWMPQSKLLIDVWNPFQWKKFLVSYRANGLLSHGSPRNTKPKLIPSTWIFSTVTRVRAFSVSFSGKHWNSRKNTQSDTGGTWTRDHKVKSLALSQLSYGALACFETRMMRVLYSDASETSGAL